jgi:hypothetical protein
MLVRIAVAVIAIWFATVLIGLVQPIGMFGFLAAVVVTVAVAAFLIARGGSQAISSPAPSADLPNAKMVDRFDSYMFNARKALPAPAAAEIDAISQLLPSLKQSITRVGDLDPAAQDARRLMSIHLPGLVERYVNVPPSYRHELDGEGKSVDQRLIEGLTAGRSALSEVSEQLARADLAAFETQGRFLQSRYVDEPLQPATPELKQPNS